RDDRRTDRGHAVRIGRGEGASAIEADAEHLEEARRHLDPGERALPFVGGRHVVDTSSLIADRLRAGEGNGAYAAHGGERARDVVVKTLPPAGGRLRREQVHLDDVARVEAGRGAGDAGGKARE